MISTTSNKTARFAGDDNTTEFPFTFRVDDEDYLEVILRDADGDETTQTITTEYTVALTEESGGTVTMVTPPATGEYLVIRRVQPLTQETDLENDGGFFPSTLELSLDDVVMALQQHAEELSRCPKADITSTDTGATLMASIDASVAAAAASASAASSSANAASVSAAAAAASAISAAASAAAAAQSVLDAAEYVDTVTDESEAVLLTASHRTVFFGNAVPIVATLGLEAESSDRHHNLVATGAGTVSVESATLNFTIPSGESRSVACNGTIWRII